jgi:hypothetical protein
MICFTKNNPIILNRFNPIKTNTRAYRIGEQFNLPKYKEFPFVHAESHLISKLLDRYNTINSNWSVVVLRINRKGLVLGSKPCENCDKILNAVGLTNIYYSNDDASFSDNIGNIVQAEQLTLPMTMV